MLALCGCARGHGLEFSVSHKVSQNAPSSAAAAAAKLHRLRGCKIGITRLYSRTELDQATPAGPSRLDYNTVSNATELRLRARPGNCHSPALIERITEKSALCGGRGALSCPLTAMNG